MRRGELKKTKVARREELAGRLVGYSALARAASVTAAFGCVAGAEVFFASRAEGAITPITAVTPSEVSFAFNASASTVHFLAGVLDLPFQLRNFVTSYNVHDDAYAKFRSDAGAVQVAVNGTESGTVVVKNFGLHSGLENKDFGNKGVLGHNGFSSSTSFGPILPKGQYAVAQGYLGFRKVVNPGVTTYYGWLRVELQNTKQYLIGTIRFLPVDGVYGAVGLKGDDLLVGEVPEPSVAALGGLGLLALGARGVREMRRRASSSGGPVRRP